MRWSPRGPVIGTGVGCITSVCVHILKHFNQPYKLGLILAPEAKISEAL